MRPCVAAKIRTPVSAAPWSRTIGPHALQGDHVRKVAVDTDGTPTFDIAGIGDTRKTTRPWNKEISANDPVLQSTSKAAGIAPMPPLPSAASGTSVLMATTAKAAQPEWIKPAIPGDPTVVGSAAMQPLPPRQDPRNDID